MDAIEATAMMSAIDRANALELAGIIDRAGRRMALMGSAVIAPCAPSSGSGGVVGAQTPYLGMRVYKAGSPGLKALSKRLGWIPVFKIGTTVRPDVGDRIAELAQRAYGGLDVTAGGVCPRFTDYKAVAFKWPDDCPPQDHVRLVDGCFAVDLPPGLSAARFEGALRQALRPLALSAWATTREGIDQMKISGLTIADLPGASRIGGRVVKADEFYCLSPGQGSSEVIAAIGSAISTSCERKR